MSSTKIQLATVSRVLLGALLVVFGLNGFLGFIPQPAPAPEAVGFLTGLASAVYFFPLLKLVEVACGTLLLVNRATNLAVVALVPIVVNVLAFHLFLDPGGLLIACVLAVLTLHCIHERRETLKVLLS
tara:strand:+ start:152 stop:535 length:384 start_codon:yes stop_codon:yes gene_type:complete